jgi:ligand-binding sensor domain-containing protein
VLGEGLFVRALAVEGQTLEVATVDQGVKAIGLKDKGRGVGLGEGEAVEVERFFESGGELFGVGAEGLLRRSAGGWTRMLGAGGEGLADADVSALQFGADGRLWVGYFDRGLDVLDVESGQAQHVEDDHVFCVNRIVADARRGTVDVATANGLVLFDAERARPVEKQVLGRKDGLISDQVTDVAFSGSGMAVATPAGMTLMGPGGAQSLYSFEGLANNHVYALAADGSSDVVMAGTLAGISMVDEAVVRRNVTLRNSGLKRNWITAIAKVGAGWFVGTYGGGVVAMDARGVVTAMDGAGMGAVVNPNAMLVTGSHVLVGTLDGGMLVFDRRTQRWSTVREGLPSRDVTAFAERSGEVYVGTAEGVVRVAEEELP